MDDFGTLTNNFGLKPSGKSAPMKSPGGIDRRNIPSDGYDIFSDVFNSTPKFTNNNSKSTHSMSGFDYDSIFKDSVTVNHNEAKNNTSNVNSPPVYDKPIFDDDIFEMKSKLGTSSASASYGDNDVFVSVSGSGRNDEFDNMFGSFGGGGNVKAEANRKGSVKSGGEFDDLIPGFGSPASGSSRWNSDPSSTTTDKTKEKSNAADDPFVVFESMSTPVASSEGPFIDPLEEISKIGKSRNTTSGLSLSGDVFGDIDSLNGFNKPSPAFSKEINNRGKSQSLSEDGSSMGSARSSVSKEPIVESFFVYSESQTQKTPFDDLQESNQTVRNSRRSFDQSTSPSSHTEASSQVGTSPKSEEHVQHADDIWLSVSEIPLFTPVTRSPPPSRPPPPIPTRASKSNKASFASTFDSDFYSSSNSPKYSQNANASRNKEPVQVHRDEQAMDEERDRKDKEREQRRLEKERMRDIEREKERQAVERANREARERAAREARLKAERAAVQRAQTEARERAAVEAKERAEKAAAEAREKASAEKAAAESREKEAWEKAAVAKAQAEARRRAERAAVERVTAEARERAAAEARERAAAAAKMNQQKNANDLDSFFSRPSSVPKAKDSATDPLSQERRGPEGAHRASSNTGTPSNVRKASSTTNFVDDLSSIFGDAMPAGEFQDIEGETEERRRARLERQQRTQERAAKALAEKNQRDLQNQKEQEERQRVSVTLDVEIKRWVAGKEGNLRAMLSTLQYVLWPECGWQPISLTDLITGASVKKAYRKATLCIHPDKVQQKGANLQQKYVAEKVFDILKEAWNKFNSEELF